MGWVRRMMAGLMVLLSTVLVGASGTEPEFRGPPPMQPTLWFSGVGQNGQGLHATPDSACREQQAEFNPDSTYLGHTDFGGTARLCMWTGGGGSLPSVVTIWCGEGYTVGYEQCIPVQANPPVCNFDCGSLAKSSSPQPNVGNPININSGVKVQAETDYASADGLFTVQRSYTSRIGDGWKVVDPGALIMTSYGNEVRYVSGHGGNDGFSADSWNGNDWNWALQNFFGTLESVSRRRLTMVTTPTVTRWEFMQDQVVSPTGPAEMRLDMPNGEYTLFRRANGTLDGTGARRLVAIEHGKPGGYKIWYDYSDDGYFPWRIRDSRNREMILTWTDVPSIVPNGRVSKILAGVQLPDSTRLEYTYDNASSTYYAPVPLYLTQQGLTVTGASQEGVLVIVNGNKTRLRTVTRRSSAGAVLWQRQYDYGYGPNPRAMTAVRDQTGAVLAQYTYSNYSYLASSKLAGNVNSHSFQHFEVFWSWGKSNDLRRVVNPLGRTEDYWLVRGGGAARSEPSALVRVDGYATATTPMDVRTFDYWQTFGNRHLMTRSVDQLGRETHYNLDIPNGRPVGVTTAAGTPVARSDGITWHPVWDLPTRIERDGQRIDITYTADALVASQTVTDLTTHVLPYPTSGQTRTVTYTWGPNARLLSLNGPRPVDALGRDDTVQFTYDASGNVTTMTNGLGHVTGFGAYDANGRPGTMTDPNGVVTQFSYDLLGRATSIRVRHPTNASLDAVTSLTYDIEGRVKTITAPASAALTMNYDLAGLLKSVVASTGERIDYAHDAMGNVTGQTVRRTNGTAAVTITRTFDALGRLLTQTLGPGRTWTYAWDRVGNLTGVVSPRNQSTVNSFDALDRLVSSALPDGGAPGATFNQRDDLVTDVDPGGVTTTFVRNGFGEVIQEINPDRGTSIYSYNAAGDRTAAIDGRGQRIDYAHDILGRLLSAVPAGRPASESATYTWDTPAISGSFALGRLARVVDGGTTVEYGYDHRGNVTVKRQRFGTGAWAQLSFTYDLADRVTQITYPSGRMVSYTFNTLGRVTQVRTRASSAVTTWTTLASGMTYEAFGPLLRANYGNGLRMIQSWGNDGRLANRRLERSSDAVRLSSLTYAYDATDNITGITDTLVSARTRSFAYDPVDRLSRVTGTFSGFAREDIVHDTNGNRLRVERRTVATAASPSAVDTYALSPGTNRLISITGASGSRSFSYDLRGNLAGETRSTGPAVAVTYDGRGRLTAYASGGASQTMTYNGADERVAVVTTPASGPVDTRIYVYDLDHRIIGEYGPGGNADVRAEYIWTLPEVGASGPTGGDDGLGGYMPLAVVTGSGSAAAVRWVHGDHMGTPLLITDAAGNPVTPVGTALTGFPGQFANAVLLPGAQHYYNRYRDYDPTTGRYIQADPIGLEGDANPYAYALGNPLRYTDPSGEFVPMLVGAAVGMGFEMLTNRCASLGDIAMAGAIGGIGGGIGKLALLRHGPRALTRNIGREWSHAIPQRFIDRMSPGPLKSALSQRGGLNGSWVTPARHHRHDPFRYVKGMDRHDKWSPALQMLDRVPDWLKASVGSGAAGSAAIQGGRCGCQ
jgi:RHS repeat-associated protein